MPGLSLPLTAPATVGKMRCPLLTAGPFSLPGFGCAGHAHPHVCKGQRPPHSAEVLFLITAARVVPWHHVSPPEGSRISLEELPVPHSAYQQASPSPRMQPTLRQSDPPLWNLTPDSWAFEFSTMAKKNGSRFISKEDALSLLRC